MRSTNILLSPVYRYKVISTVVDDDMDRSELKKVYRYKVISTVVDPANYVIAYTCL